MRDLCCFLDDRFSCKYGSRKVGNEQSPAPCLHLIGSEVGVGGYYQPGGAGGVPVQCTVQRHARWSQLVSSRCPTATWTTASGGVDPVCRCRTTESLAGNQATAGFGRKNRPDVQFCDWRPSKTPERKRQDRTHEKQHEWLTSRWRGSQQAPVVL